MTANQLAALISGLALFVALVPIAVRLRRNNRIRRLVWDEIIGHDASTGVPYKPSLSERLTDHADLDLRQFARINGRLGALEIHTRTAARESSRAAQAAEETKAAVTNGDAQGT